jgi:serine/threonine protein kinase
VNYRDHVTNTFTDIQLCDVESTVRDDSKYALEGAHIGSALFRSPEAHLELRWGTPTDIWSFGTMASSQHLVQERVIKTNGRVAQLISLHYGRGFHIFKRRVPIDHEDYGVEVLLKHYRCFGPYPLSYKEIADDERLAALPWLMEQSPRESLRPFHMSPEREISTKDRDFICKIMKLDPRERPSAQQLLEDPWFSGI